MKRYIILWKFLMSKFDWKRKYKLFLIKRFFHNVCELDLVFNFYKVKVFFLIISIKLFYLKVYSVVDEMFLAGEIRETSQIKVLKQLTTLTSLEWFILINIKNNILFLYKKIFIIWLSSRHSDQHIPIEIHITNSFFSSSQ